MVGSRIAVSAPIDTIPIFVRAGSILPLGAADRKHGQKQAIAKMRVYPGADADFTLYSDDGKTYAYEKGESEITHLHWDDAAKTLRHTGAQAWTGPDAELIEIVGAK